MSILYTDIRSSIHWFKTMIRFEKPLYVIFALQTGRKNVMSQDIRVFDNCNLSNMKVYLNLEFYFIFYPYDDLNLDFGKKIYVVLFDMYAHFHKALWNQLRNAVQRALVH